MTAKLVLDSAGKASGFWTLERIKTLVELYVSGMSCKVIGEALGCSKNAVIGKANRLGLEREAMEGMTADQIATYERLAEERTKPPPPPAARIVFPADGGCLWPHGRPGEVGFCFCEAAIAHVGVPYCDAHMTRAYVPAAKRSDIIAKLLWRSVDDEIGRAIAAA
jgi:GcrA cell cycle regulator